MTQIVKALCHFVSVVLAFGAGLLSLAWAHPPHPHSWDVVEPSSMHLFNTALSVFLVGFIVLGANACLKLAYGDTIPAAHVKAAGSFQFICGEFAVLCILATGQTGTLDFDLPTGLMVFAVMLACVGFAIPVSVRPQEEASQVVEEPVKSTAAGGDKKSKKSRGGKKDKEEEPATPAAAPVVVKQRIMSWFVAGLAAVGFALGIGLGELAVLSRRQEPFTSCFGGLSDIPPLTLTQEPSALASLAAARDLPLGALRFSFTKDNRIVITDPQRRGSAPVYSTVAGSAFVTGAFGAFSAKNDHEGGLFTIVDTPTTRSHGTVIKSVKGSADDQSVVVSGALLFYSVPKDASSEVQVPFTMTFDAVSAQRAQFTVAVDALRAGVLVRNSSPLRLYLNHMTDEDEHFFGFGEQFDALDFKQSCVPILTSEQGVGRGLMPITFFLNLYLPGAGGSWQTTYTAVPYYVTSAMRGLFLENTEFTVFDMSRPGRVTVEVVVGSSGRVVGHVMGGANPKDLIREYTEYAGRMRVLPEWTSKGAIVGLQGGTEVVKAKVKVLQDAGVPISALWLQDWSGKVETGFGRRLLW
jgi:hypothetical protein